LVEKLAFLLPKSILLANLLRHTTLPVDLIFAASFIWLFSPFCSSFVSALLSSSLLQINSRNLPASPSPTSFALLKQLNPNYKDVFNRTHPLLLIGLPKTGTRSLTDLLLALDVPVAHQIVRTGNCPQVPCLLLDAI
jgi:hypothetical protein